MFCKMLLEIGGNQYFLFPSFALSSSLLFVYVGHYEGLGGGGKGGGRRVSLRMPA